MAVYVANWGNDINSGADWANAKKTIQGAIDEGSDIKTQGRFTFSGAIHPADIDGTNKTLITTPPNENITYGDFQNIIIKNYYNANYGNHNNNILYCIGGGEPVNAFYGNNNMVFLFNDTFTINGGLNHNTITGNYIVYLKDDSVKQNNIFYSKLKVRHPDKIYYNLFINCQVKIGSESTYTQPSGTSNEEKMADLRQRAANVYGGNPESYFPGCQYYTGAATDIFNDPDNDDYSLVPGSIATYMSYMGSYVGKYPPSLSWTMPNDYTLTNFTGQKITDQTSFAKAEGSIKTNPTGEPREVLSVPFLDNPAYRNGVNMNTEDIVAGSTTPSGSIQSGHVYRVEGGEITYESYPDIQGGTVDYPEGSFFVGVEDNSGNDVTNYTGTGSAREIYFEKFARKVKWKFSKTDAGLTSAVEIQLYADKQPMVNTDSEGEPTHGNADDGFDEATSVALIAKYMQPIVEFQVDQIMAY